ncbi:MAG TPA: glycosyltransferase family 4 protein [Pyrinomonadaceae bacterium]
MRIAVINWSRRRVGGVETYLGNIIPEIIRKGHELSFWSEVDVPRDREQIGLPAGVPAWCAAELGEEHAFERLRAWRPDLLYVHKVMHPRVEERLLDVAPAVFFAHDYYGTCISGLKTHKYPEIVPCERSFGAGCLLRYYPRRCGGLSPLTMLKLFRLQSSRLALLPRYKAIVTHSSHMREEYLRNGLSAEKVHSLSYYAHPGGEAEGGGVAPDGREFARVAPAEKGQFRLLYSGRMDKLKGGGVFISALPKVREALGASLAVTFAGDGPEREHWERQARATQSRLDGVTVRFVGWLDKQQLDHLYAEADLLVFPSLWPEPFGLTGLEAGQHGLPVAAFPVGGVKDWLIDGVNGHLAEGKSLDDAALAKVIVKCLDDGAAYARLRRGAIGMTNKFTLDVHLQALMSVLRQVLGKG